MAAGKNYLKAEAFPTGGTPAQIAIYRNEDASKMSLTVTDITAGETIGAFVLNLDVLHDVGGHFVLVPVDPSEITGLAELLQE
jgi:hypothetical protein